MASNNESVMDFDEHRKTYERFVRLTKWTVVLVAAVLVLMAIFLT